MGVVLGIYLSRSGHSAFQIGAVLAFGLAGSACATTVVGIAADRVGRKRFLVLLSILTALGGLSFTPCQTFHCCWQWLSLRCSMVPARNVPQFSRWNRR